MLEPKETRTDSMRMFTGPSGGTEAMARSIRSSVSLSLQSSGSRLVQSSGLRHWWQTPSKTVMWMLSSGSMVAQCAAGSASSIPRMVRNSCQTGAL